MRAKLYSKEAITPESINEILENYEKEKHVHFKRSLQKYYLTDLIKSKNNISENHDEITTNLIIMSTRTASFGQYQNHWKHKFSKIPNINETTQQPYQYIQQIFQEIVGFNKFINGHWGTKGSAIAEEIIEKCKSQGLNEAEMIDFLLKKLDHINVTQKNTFFRQAPRPEGNTAMRIYHCIDVLEHKVTNKTYEVPKAPPTPSLAARCTAIFSRPA